MGKWIPIEERRPNKRGNYIVTYTTRTGRRLVSARYWDGYAFAKGTGSVISWLPLPEPDKETQPSKWVPEIW